MPLFYDLDGFNDNTPRVAGRLKAIREMLQNFPGRPEGSIPPKNTSASLLLSTWNLQAFDGGESNNRTDESFWYIAEIISPISQRFASSSFGLTLTEIKVANLIKEGIKSKEIARILTLSPRTIDKYREKIRSKLSIQNKKVNIKEE